MSQKLVKITLDGKELEVAEGASVLQLAMDHGTMIPHFCYHPGIGVDGNCRLCLVEVVGMPKLATSCNLYAKEGMVVNTKSDPVVKARKGVLEFFLLNHPLDCPFCDKGGECPLQNYTLDSGQNSSRFTFEKNHKPKHQDIGDHIMLDKERCVLCSRCVRFGRDMAGHEELQITMRGSKSEIFVPEGEKLDSKFTGNYADICPVGALTTKEYRFKARPWELKTVNTLCGECSLGCNVQAWRKNEDVLRLTPRIEPSVNEWWLCDKGRFSINQNKQEPSVDGIYRKSAAAFEKLSATDGIPALVSELTSGKFKNLGLVADSSMSNEEFFQLKTLASKIANAKVFAPIRESVKQAYDAMKSNAVEMNFPSDFDRSKSTLIIGEAIENDHPVLAIRFRDKVRKKKLNLFTAHRGTSELDRIATKLEVSDWKAFFADLPELVSKHAIETVMLSDQAIDASVSKAVVDVLAAFAKSGVKVTILHSGTNDRGILDQWSEGTVSYEKITDHSLDALLYYGKIPQKFHADQSSNLKLFVHATRWQKDADVSAHWHIPLESFLEKDGTYTNHFGKVQTLRRSTKQVDKGTTVLRVLNELAKAMGEPAISSSEIYSKVAGSVSGYPKAISEIIESKQTYHHYERAVWR